VDMGINDLEWDMQFAFLKTSCGIDKHTAQNTEDISWGILRLDWSGWWANAPNSYSLSYTGTFNRKICD